MVLSCVSQCDVAMTLQIRDAVNSHVEQCNHLVLPEALPEDRSRKVCIHEEDLPVQWQQSVLVHHELHQIASVTSRFYLQIFYTVYSIDLDVLVQAVSDLDH